MFGAGLNEVYWPCNALRPFGRRIIRTNWCQYARGRAVLLALDLPRSSCDRPLGRVRPLIATNRIRARYTRVRKPVRICYPATVTRIIRRTEKSQGSE